MRYNENDGKLEIGKRNIECVGKKVEIVGI